ncbi:hypothetical protein KR50_08560 [Jeotgalibacillus campisalis]|uniref:Uncharacterized protein n=1 Tax=Jeotgalibacillus campisalis TaxID=220754 RepID=A0A0C2RL63_9BACL|nr:hypothetical protein KR50_08560 [Jeotgalibacillus campisalis]
MNGNGFETDVTFKMVHWIIILAAYYEYSVVSAGRFASANMGD